MSSFSQVILGDSEIVNSFKEILISDPPTRTKILKKLKDFSINPIITSKIMIHLSKNINELLFDRAYAKTLLNYIIEYIALISDYSFEDQIQIWNNSLTGILLSMKISYNKFSVDPNTINAFFNSIKIFDQEFLFCYDFMLEHKRKLDAPL